MRPSLLEGRTFPSFRKRVLSLPWKAIAFRTLLPSQVKERKNLADWEKGLKTLEEIIKRIRELGGETIILKDDFLSTTIAREPTSLIYRQIVDFLREGSYLADSLRINLLIDPFPSRELLSGYGEGIRIMEEVNRPGIRLVADIDGMVKKGEPFSLLSEGKNYLGYVHLADTRRRPPGKGKHNFGGFFRILKEIGYDELVAVDCKWSNIEKEAKASFHFLKNTWQGVWGRKVERTKHPFLC